MKTIDIDKLTPAMRHYVETKNKNPEAYLFYRMGDFYELFFDDAIEVSSLLDLTLTKKSGGLEEKIPMCGVPFRVANQYIKRLVKKGYSVSVCDQVEDPKEAKGLVKREIIKIVTPGTFVDEENPDETRRITSVAMEGKLMMLAHCDYASGRVSLEQKIIWDHRDALSFLDKQFGFYRPAEVIFNDFTYERELSAASKQAGVVSIHRVEEGDPELYKRYFELFLSEYNPALNLLVAYLEKTQLHEQDHLYIQSINDGDGSMDLSDTTIRNLELVENTHDSTKKDSLYDTLDHCTTRMGSRKMREKILRPMMAIDPLNAQYDRIEFLQSNRILFDDILEKLGSIYDIDRLALSIANQNLSPKQMLRLQKSLAAFSDILFLLEREGDGVLYDLFKDIDPCSKLAKELETVFIDDPPAAYHEQRFIRKGYDSELDELFDSSEGGAQWILQLEEREREATGIKNLKIKYNKILGYFFDVSKSNIPLVPDRFIRKQTLVGSERFFTDELKEQEEKILHAKERALERQLELLDSLRLRIAGDLEHIQAVSEAVAELDVICSFATIADQYGYVRPSLNSAGILSIENGRHPVVERTIEEEYIPNNTQLDPDGGFLQVITGPNMAGKSTYMRQVALIQIMAQIGSFVPCERADLPIVDQIFTRIGASDFLTRGKSTFMVEMTEVAEILRLATPRSLILFDEVGRGTSTYDGLSIAWSIIEYIYDEVHAKTLFATHYFELTELADKYDGILNVTVATEEVDGEIRFLRKIVLGESNYSFGIDVAKLAGVKPAVIERARQVLVDLEKQNNLESAALYIKDEPVIDGEDDELREKIKSIDLDNTTPLEALMLLQSLKEEVDRA
ncbi:DNA mismatch repair protein MutS [Aedoeadaptatus nemausensis]|uniref:DNA mismatch repair protein MutS n=1 Tax=Aedoeadaptatus nemausensis TaxID=2582829 RepID=A0A6V6XZF8_9FIRM|nr:DNA mismatch repair protein MutS [Peptoniphilus nemausensis]CAC9924810.1 DNA mismatch repair protein MutS [Peptoniphilus nemausensis]